MRNLLKTTFLSFSLLLSCFASLVFANWQSNETTSRVYVIEIEGPIDNGIATYIKRGVDVAVADSLTTAIFFHIDTFGGLVDAADEIRKTILDIDLLTVAFIDKNAASAGALIALACDSVYMAPGSSIGAATVVQGSGEKAPEKLQSYMRSLMRATAESNGRNPTIAEAMVDESIEIDGIIESGKLLSLSSSEAVKFGIADLIVESKAEIASILKISNPAFVPIAERWEESVLRFLANPVISSILMLMMLGGLYYELQSPGIGFPGAVSVIGAFLFFAPLYIMGLAQSWEIVLFVIGVLLMILEIFVIPGFGLAGLTGITLILFSLGAALIGNIGLAFPELSLIASAVWTLSVTLIIGIGLIMSLAKYLPQNQFFKRLVLEDTLNSTNKPFYEQEEELTGKTALAVSPLRPSGLILVDGKRVNVVSDGDFIASGEHVIIVSAVGNRIVVTRKT